MIPVARPVHRLAREAVEIVNSSLGVLLDAQRLRTHWLPHWHADVDDALDILPELEGCPPELYRELFELTPVARRRLALVSRKGTPVAVIALRFDGGLWRPVTTWLIPGTLFPVAEGRELASLVSLNLPVFIAWWRQPVSPPKPGFLIEQYRSTATHWISCSPGFEQYWKQTGQMRDVEKARRRCAGLRFAVNVEGADSWAVNHWAERWGTPDSSHREEVALRLAVCRYWTPRGRQFTFSFSEGDRFVAADICFADQGDIVGQVHYRDPAYDRLSVGTRIIDAVHHWAAEAGFNGQDFGGGHQYKKRWAPEGGIRHQLLTRANPASFSHWYGLLRRRIARIVR